MRNRLLALLIVTLLLSSMPGPVWADGMILPEAASPDYIVVRYHHVTVRIEDNHAVTRVEQEFVNPHPFAVSGRYLFPVPPGAMVSNFEASLGGQRQTVIRQDAATTNAALYDVVAQRQDPSLLQYADWESLAFDLELPAGGARRMLLSYDEVLAPTGGMYRYRYILSTERYSMAPLEDVSITVDLALSSGLSNLYVPTHNVSTERLGEGRARVTWQAQDVRPTENFDLFFTPAEGGFGSGLLTGTREGHEHFLFLFAPESEAAREDALPKDIVFVIDRSGSMAGEKIVQAQNALHFILGQLNPDDRFSIVGFDDRLLRFSTELAPVERETLREARRFVDDLYADANTDLEAALQAGLEILSRSESRPEATRLVVFLTDGLPTAGVTDGGLIASLVAEANARVAARLHVFGVGYDVNSHLLDRLAAENGGSVTYVQPGENLELVLSDFYARIANPVLTDIVVDFEGLEASDVYPAQLPDLFQGASLLLTGRYHATDSEVTVRVRGQAGGQARTYVYHFDLRESTGHDFVPRLWATRRIGTLLDQVRVERESAALVAEIRALGLGYGLVTPYTTFAIAAQADGAASEANMRLYGDQEALNQVSGQTTIQARVQNQSYQQATQANLASGANVVNSGARSVAQVGDPYADNADTPFAGAWLDLSLLQGQDIPDDLITDAWLAENIKVDREVAFGSAAYFELADDPAIRPFLQSAANVIFAHNGEVIAVQGAEGGASVPEPPEQSGNARGDQRSGVVKLLSDLYTWLGLFIVSQ